MDYSTAYAWLQAGKVKSVVLKGQTVIGTLSAPETVKGREVTRFHTLTPAEVNRLVLRGVPGRWGRTDAVAVRE